MPPNVWGQRVIQWPKYIISTSQKWSDEEPGGRTNHPIVEYNNQTLHMTASIYNSPGYIRVQWPWIGMIQNMTCVVITTYNIDRSESPWWRYTNDHDLHQSWRYTMDQDFHNGWRYLTYTGIKSQELKSHEHWNDQGGSICECHQSEKSYTHTAMSTCPTMWIEVSMSNIVGHRLITSQWCIPLTNARSPIDNENGNQGTRVQSNKCE